MESNTGKQIHPSGQRGDNEKEMERIKERGRMDNDRGGKVLVGETETKGGGKKGR